MEISQPLEELDWIPRPKILALRRLGITTVEHLLTHFPRRHEDRSAFPEFPRDESDVPICLSGEVIKTSLRRFGGWKKIFEATLQELNANALSQPLICRWFNLHYVQKMIATGEHLVLSEFFAMQMLIASRRTDSHARVSAAHCGRGELMQKFLHALPFELTTAQKKVIAEIQSDLAAKYPMNRLLQGDVGSGKTVVAIAAILLAVEAGYQAAFMAPTQVLAEQHYAVLRRWLEPLGVKLSIRTAARQEESFLPLVDGNENADVIIGTHALLYEKVSFSNLGLAVIDEQHKFGVAQRARLTSREPTPDVLVMTATPIPRTVTMTVYGDLDVSVIDEMPRGRGKVVTAVRDSSKLGEVLTFLRRQLEAARQLYVIYPLIDESEKLEVKAAAAEYELWRERLHPFRCELLHGRIAPAEKQQIMERFRRGETNALISTTVLEVGVDVRNASVMLIENAERFGLAQLHKLGGRIGRGEHKPFCILLTSDTSKETSGKLTVLEKTSNGFEVAEADWELRGPGDLLGTAQSGLPALKIGNLKADAELMRRARAAAVSIFQADPRLEAPEDQRFRSLIVEQQGRTLSNVS